MVASVLQMVQQGIQAQWNERSMVWRQSIEWVEKTHYYGILQRYAYPEIPPHVEYKLTAFGEKFVHILNEIEKLNQSSTV